eukprot:sb/3472068/
MILHYTRYIDIIILSLPHPLALVQLKSEQDPQILGNPSRALCRLAQCWDTGYNIGRDPAFWCQGDLGGCFSLHLPGYFQPEANTVSSLRIGVEKKTRPPKKRVEKKPRALEGSASRDLIPASTPTNVRALITLVPSVFSLLVSYGGFYRITMKRLCAHLIIQLSNYPDEIEI